MTGVASSLVTGVVIIAMLFVLVRPGSQGPSLVTNVSTGLKNLIGAATGGGTWANG
jgi:hypothetical protein